MKKLIIMFMMALVAVGIVSAIDCNMNHVTDCPPITDPVLCNSSALVGSEVFNCVWTGSSCGYDFSSAGCSVVCVDNEGTCSDFNGDFEGCVSSTEISTATSSPHACSYNPVNGMCSRSPVDCKSFVEPDGEIPEINTSVIIVIIAVVAVAGVLLTKKK